MVGRWFELESEALPHRAGLPSKVVSFYIVPLDPALPAKAGRGTCRQTSPLKRDNMGHEISDEIFEEALKEIKGYVDITIDDLKKIQEIAHRHARGKPGLTSAPVNPSTPQPKGRDLPSILAQAEGLRVDPEPCSFPPSSKTGLGTVERVKMSWKDYFSKMKGGSKSPPGVGISELLWTWFGSAIAVGVGFYLSLRYFEPRDLVLIITSFGASAVLVFGAIKSPLAQPRNLIGGTVISAFIGVASYKLFGNNIALASTIGVSCSIAAMLLTKTVHPPAGGTTLIAIIGGKEIHDLGFVYPFLPAGAGVFLLLTAGLLINNLSRNRKYPEYWF